MVYDAARLQRDEATKASHEQALANGEKRLLARTVTGELHSYAEDEIGFVRTGLGPNMRSAFGMGMVALVLVALTAFSIYMIASPTSQGEPPFWGALVMTVPGLAGLAYTARLTLKEIAAKRIRRERGVPDPGSSNV